MGAVLNKLRSIENSEVNEADPGMNTAGKEIDQANFTRILARMEQMKDAVTPKHYSALRAGIRSLHMGRRPTLEQMSALMDLLETILGYVADDQTLFQRLKYDLKQDAPDTADEEDTDKEDTEIEDTADDETEKDADDEESKLIGDKLRDLKS